MKISELVNLKCEDVKNSENEIFVNYEPITIPDSLKKHIKSFLKWKKQNNEPTSPSSPLLIGQRGPLSPIGVQQLVKSFLIQCNTYSPGKSCEAIRHSYALRLYQKTNDLKIVQKQLRLKSYQSVLIYENVENRIENLKVKKDAIKNLWTTFI